MAKDPVTHVLTPQEYLRNVDAATMPPMNNCRLIEVSLGVYRVLYTFFWPAEFPGYHQCQQESQ